MKKILTIQDISCLGKCSLTVALPLLSALGNETVILPSALLSTHTMFKDFTFKDLSDQMLPICKHWQKEQVKFDAIYTGYLGNKEMIETVKQIISEFKTTDTMVFIDPVMADNGKLYPGFDTEYAAEKASLCALADMIVPNISEACFLTGIPYQEEYDEAYIKRLLKGLLDLGAQNVIITGVSLSANKTGVYAYEKANDQVIIYQNALVEACYHGTGDIFSSTLIGCLTQGIKLESALKIAADYTADTISVTLENSDKPWYGVDFEKTLPDLIKTVTSIK